jgi:hypothetical protein
MSGRARTRSAKNTGQRKNLNTRDSDPKPKSKKSKRGTKVKGVLKEGLLGTLFEEVEGVEESLQFPAVNLLKKDVESRAPKTGPRQVKGEFPATPRSSKGPTARAWDAASARSGTHRTH